MTSGFQSRSRTLGTAGVAGVLGVGVYLLQRLPSADPGVVVNAFAQVPPVSIAEVVGGGASLSSRTATVDAGLETALVEPGPLGSASQLSP